MRCASFFCSTVSGATAGVATGAAGSAIGASILEVAGWTVAGASVSAITVASVVGTATIVGGIACCVGTCIACGPQEPEQIANNVIASTQIGWNLGLLCLPATAVAGAAMMGIKGAGLGFAAASGGIGMGVLGFGTSVLIAVLICAGQTMVITGAIAEIVTNRHSFSSNAAINNSRTYNPSQNGPIIAMKATIENGKIVAIDTESAVTVLNKDGKPVTGAEFLQVTASNDNRLEGPKPMSMA